MSEVHTFTQEELSEFAAQQRALAVSWVVDYVRRLGCPWSHKISEMIERQFKASV